MARGGKMDADVIEERRLDARPLTTFAQFVAELAEGKPDAGIIRASVNMTTVLGGFVRFYGTASEQRACARYRSLFEASQVGGARAVDPSREPVDGGWLNPEAVFENGADARRELARIDDRLGVMDVKRIRFVVIAEWGPTSYAKHFYNLRVPNSQAVSRAKVEVRRIAARLAELMGLSTRAAA